uniref:Uncharacterized protein n=1 Tax=Candidatus Kentrum sp. LFY TaxID=2126342 RepID=A0A450WLC7_9GAMM|nr:MAG: hypothetical protein BECKLFY1418A_GA0070994_10457 [Candidatus Kentron sp. LFY]VFK17851.1 MAG: hypothetical protein BECKLFY1418C_GA0070996_10369 [Candidatus Kentron sp. LFY]
MKRHQAGIKATLALVISTMGASVFISGCAADRYITREKQRQAALESAYQRALEEKGAVEAERIQMEETKADQQAEQRRLRTEIAQLENDVRRLDAREETLRTELQHLRRQETGKTAKILELEREIADVQQTNRQKQRKLDTLRGNL